jgi:hypothetical protein
VSRCKPVWSGQHLPKKDLFGKIDTFVDIVPVSGDTAALSVTPALLGGYINIAGELNKEAARTTVVESNYHPDWQHASNIGSVEFLWLRVPNPVPQNCRVVGVVQDHDKMTSHDLVGHVEVPVSSHDVAKESESWYPVMDSAGKQVQGHDKNSSVIYIETQWLDAAASSKCLTPTIPKGRLTSIDLSYRDLAPSVFEYTLHHAGVLKLLKVAGISTGPHNQVGDFHHLFCLFHHLLSPLTIMRERSLTSQFWKYFQRNIELVLQVLVESFHWPGKSVPERWEKGVHFYESGKKDLRKDQVVVVDSKMAKILDAEGELYTVEVGDGKTKELSAGEISILAPLYKGWGSTLRVLDLSTNYWAWGQLPESFCATIARMPALEDLNLAGMPVEAVLQAIKTNPTMKLFKLDVSAVAGRRNESESELLIDVLADLRDSFAQPHAFLRAANCLLTVDHFARALTALAGVGSQEGADIVLSLPKISGSLSLNPFATRSGIGRDHDQDLKDLKKVLEATNFEGGICCSGQTPDVAEAVLSSLSCQTSLLGCTRASKITSVEMRNLAKFPGLLGVNSGSLSWEPLQDALQAFLTKNSSVKLLDISSNPVSVVGIYNPDCVGFYPHWSQGPQGPQGGGYQFCADGSKGKGWYLSAEKRGAMHRRDELHEHRSHMSARTQARTQARTHARTHARTRARTHTHTHTCR